MGKIGQDSWYIVIDPQLRVARIKPPESCRGEHVLAKTRGNGKSFNAQGPTVNFVVKKIIQLTRESVEKWVGQAPVGGSLGILPVPKLAAQALVCFSGLLVGDARGNQCAHE